MYIYLSVSLDLANVFERRQRGHAPAVPDHNSITFYCDYTCLQWDHSQLVDLFLPCMVSVEMENDSEYQPCEWIKGYTFSCWSRGLNLVGCSLIIGVVKLLVKSEVDCLVYRKTENEELFRPSVRSLLRKYMTFPLGSPEFMDRLKISLVIRKNNMRLPFDPVFEKKSPPVNHHVPEEVDALLNDPEILEDPLALHIREHHESQREALDQNTEIRDGEQASVENFRLSARQGSRKNLEREKYHMGATWL